MDQKIVDQPLRMIAIADHSKTGGAAQLFNRTNAILRKNGHSVTEWTWDHFDQPPPSVLNRKFHSGLRRLRLEGLFIALKNNIRHIYSWDLANKLEKTIKEQGPFDFAHVQNLHGRLSTHLLRVLKRAKIPIVYQINDYYFFCNSYYAYNKVLNQPCKKCIRGNVLHAIMWNCSQYFNCGFSKIEAVRRLFLHILNPWKHVSLFLVTSQTTQQLLVEWGVDKDKIRTIKNPMLEQEFETETSIGDQVIYYGSDLSLKGTETFLNSLEHLPAGTEVGVYLMGMSPETVQKFESVASRKNLKLSLDNHISWQTGLKNIVAQKARVVVVPSQWWVTSENVVYEAMFLSKPVVVADIGGNQELVDQGKTGFLFKARDSQDLSNKVQRFLSDKWLAASMGNSARVSAQNKLSEKVFYKDFANAFKTVLR